MELIRRCPGDVPNRHAGSRHGGLPSGSRVNGTKVGCRQLGVTNAAVYIVNEPVPQR
jgi:hypothetical protein